MPFAAALSTNQDSSKALEEVCTKARAQLPDAPDLAVLFFSSHHAANAARLATDAHKRLGPRSLLGCPGEAIVGGDREIENQPAMSLWLGKWKAEVKLSPFHLVFEETADGSSLLGWPDALAGADPKQAVVLML